MKFYLFFLLTVFIYSQEGNNEVYKALDIYAKVLNHIGNSYYKEVDVKEFIITSLKKAVNSLDPHSEYLTAEEYKKFNGELSGDLFGIGLEYEIKDEDVVITRVYNGSPAYKAGLFSGMSIEKINGVSAYGKTRKEIDEMINGKIGTKLTLTYFYKNRFKKVTLIRDKIDLEDIEYFKVSSKIIYLKIFSFQAGISKKFLNIVLKSKTEKLIIDLRDNPGGYVDESVKLADMFIDKGVIVSSKERNRPENFYRASEITPLSGYKTVILINSETASASEIFTAAMKEHKKAVVIGERSYGKGSIQSIIELGKGQGALKLTVALYYTPKHNMIQGFGITPHIEIPKHFDIADKEREENIKNMIKVEKNTKKEIYVPDYLKDDKQFMIAVNFLND